MWLFSHSSLSIRSDCPVMSPVGAVELGDEILDGDTAATRGWSAVVRRGTDPTGGSRGLAPWRRGRRPPLPHRELADAPQAQLTAPTFLTAKRSETSAT